MSTSQNYGPGQPGYPPQGHPQAPQDYPPPHSYPPPQGYPPPHGYPGGPSQKNNTPLIIGGVLLLLALIGAAVFLMSNGDDSADYAASTPAAAPAPAPAALPADPALAGATTPPPGAVSSSAPAASNTRRFANSPGDGYLSLRSNPNASAGSRLAQIPHGATVDVGSCGTSDTVGGVAGRWCSATYDGRSGYVFDAYLASSQPAPRAASRSSSGGSLPSPGPTEEAESLIQVTGAEALSIRTHPSINAPRVAAVPRGGTFTTDVCEINPRREGGRSRSWCHVEFVDYGDGRKDYNVQGWVSVDNNFVTVIAG